MFTTRHLQELPDYFPTPKECLEAEHSSVNTNSRYNTFTQTHFTAGDIDQFELYRSPTNGSLRDPEFSTDKYHFMFAEKYKDLNTQSVDNTFSYIFHKFKKGLFVKIQNNQLKVFLPFSKKNFVNEWHSQIKVDPKYNDIYGFIQHIQTLEKRPYKPHHINKFTDTWYANNCLVRYEFPISEGDCNNTNMCDMLKVLCQQRKLPDIEFFINRRDFPILKTDGTEPYNHMFDSDNKPLLSHNYDKYAPVLSMVGSDGFCDVAIPTGDDWARVTRPEGKYFEKSATRSFEVGNTPWEQRKPTAVFRGTSTGIGVTIETNPRLKASYLSHITPPENGVPLLDAGITSWKLRPRKIQGQPYLQTIDIASMPFELATYLTPEQQSQYKYIVHIDGYVSAFRLSVEMFSGSCLLIVDSPYYLWFKKDLKPYVHYIPIKRDLSNLLEIIRWCREHDKECETIANNAKEYANTFLSKDGVLDYLQALLFSLKKHTGTYIYNYIKLTDIQHEEETKWLHKHRWSKIYNGDVHSIPVERDANTVQGIEWAFAHVSLPEGKEIFNNKLTKVEQIEIGGRKWAVKSGLDETRKKELIHEAFVILSCLNKAEVPNFIYGVKYEPNRLALEYVEGITLREYLLGKEFNFPDFINILTQLSLALHLAQDKCGFIHYDLTPWNIVLQKVEAKEEYTIQNHTYEVKFKWRPMILDMGRSHVIFNNTHYGMINPYKMSKIQDVLTLITTSLYIITGRKNLSQTDVNTTLKIMNFLANTKYRPKPFYRRGYDGLGEVRYFLRTAKKYTELLTGPKYDLEHKTPLDFVRYIYPNILVTPRVYKPIPTSQRFVLDTMFNHPRKKEDFVKRILNISSLSKHSVQRYYFLQYVHDVVKSILQGEDYEKCKAHLDKLKGDANDITIIDAETPSHVKEFTETTFQDIHKLKEYVDQIHEHKGRMWNEEYYDMVCFINDYKGEYEIPKVETKNYKLEWANLYTFYKRAKRMLKENIKGLPPDIDNTEYKVLLKRIKRNSKWIFPDI